MKRPKWHRLVGPLVMAGALVALVVALRNQGADARDALARTDLAHAGAALVAVLGGLFASMQVWRALLAELGSRLTSRAAMRIFFVGQLGKYLPGSVFAVATQMELGRAHRVPRARAGAAWLLFMAVLVVTGLVCGLVALSLTSPDAMHRYGWVLAGLPVGLACLSPPVVNRWLAFVLRTLRRQPLERPLTWPGVGVAAAWAMVMWALYAGHLMLLIVPLHPDPARPLPLLALGAFALAWTAGLLFVIAPAGAGVREAVLIVALAPTLTTPEATAVALLSRLLLTVGDALWGGIGALGMSAERRRQLTVDPYPPD